LGSAIGAGRTAGETGSDEKARPNEQPKAKKDNYPQAPSRKLGKTGVNVPNLGLGCNRLNNQVILRVASQWGITYWDTAHSYVGGNSELTIGKFIARNPEARKNLFIVSKASGAESIAEAEQCLATSLERLKTDYIDLYYGVHGLDEPEQLTAELGQWVKKAKERKLIRFFGFSTHENMAENLDAAAKLDWIDAIMTTYNFRLMQDEKMQAAVEACYKAGIGIIAMKTLGVRTETKVETEADKKIVGHFQAKGFTEMQAKIKAVLRDKRITSACVGMSNIAEVTENAGAVVDKTKLTRQDMQVLGEYAKATCTGYCAGCADICAAAAGEGHINDVMRCLMYYNGYGDHEMARECFANIPGDTRRRLARADYRLAEVRCPQRLPIAKLVKEALQKLA
jgi:predicted aldo/keto reductase-like oxidoreductase